MKPILLASLSLVLSGAALAQPDPNGQGMAANPPEAQIPPPPVRLDTPVNAARYFMNAFANDYATELNLSFVVAGARVGFYGADEWEEIRKEVHPFNTAKNLKIDDIKADEQTDEEASVTVTAHHESPAREGRVAWRDEPTKYALKLRREAKLEAPGFGAQQNAWRVVPLSTEEVLAKPLYQQPPLQLTAALSLRDPQLLPFLRQQQAMGQLKQLGLGAMQFAQDYDLFYAFDDAAHERALRPYLKSESLYTIAGTKDEKWHFNNHLSTKPLPQLAEPARTVLFYDGSAPNNENLNFRFEEKTTICFADGHVAALAKDELKDLIWKP